MTTRRLLQTGDWVAIGDNWIQVDAAFSAQLQPDDRVLAVASTATLKRIPRGVHDLVVSAVGGAERAFAELAKVTDDAINRFFDDAASLLADDTVFVRVRAANDADIESARSRERSTTRLVLSDSMRVDMISAFKMWRDVLSGRERTIESLSHDGWTVDQVTAPLGVIGFVFEGRPNVFADATGVLKSGNTAVFRIGSDALGTANELMRSVIRPALASAGLPDGCVQLLDSVEHAAGWALFSDARLSLAVARGSGETVAELGSIAQQTGTPVSLHGTGGAWLLVGSSFDEERLTQCVLNSLDRKVCNTLNVVCVLKDNAENVVPLVVAAAQAAAAHRKTLPKIHVVVGGEKYLDPHQVFSTEEVSNLATECEWENDPEFHLVVVDTLEQALEYFNVYSPQFIISLISDSDEEQDLVWNTANAPFVGDGFTRWVDGQFALLRPELGLSNWQNGRLFARSAILSGDSAFSVRMRVRQSDSRIHR
jgi:glutamate-5-semialdehyde dehydrogenase